MAGYEQRFKPLPKTILDFGKLNLYTDKLDGGERRPTFAFKVIRGFVHATVRTGIPTDIKNGYMSVRIDPKNFYSLMILFKEVLDEKRSSIRLTIEDRIYNEETRKYDEEMVPMGAIKICRDKDKRIYISLVIDKRPKIQFYFGKEFNSVLKKEGGTEFTEAEYSQLFAQSYYMMMKDLIPKVLIDTSNTIFDSPFVGNIDNKPTQSESSSDTLPEPDDDIPF